MVGRPDVLPHSLPSFRYRLSFVYQKSLNVSELNCDAYWSKVWIQLTPKLTCAIYRMAVPLKLLLTVNFISFGAPRPSERVAPTRANSSSQQPTWRRRVTKGPRPNWKTPLVFLIFPRLFTKAPRHQRLLQLDYCGVVHVVGPKAISGTSSSTVCTTDSYRGWEIDHWEYPRGSILGPLLFFIYIDDLGDSIKAKVRLLVDDTILHETICRTAGTIRLQQDPDWCSGELGA